jgi:hypothetical protein
MYTQIDVILSILHKQISARTIRAARAQAGHPEVALFLNVVQTKVQESNVQMPCVTGGKKTARGSECVARRQDAS